MKRLLVICAFAAAVAFVAAIASASSGRSASTGALSVQEASVSQLLLPSDQAEVKYVIDTPGVVKPTGTLYVRRDGQPAFSALPLQQGWDIHNGRHPSLHLSLPARFLNGQRLFFYAQLQDPASGASATIPAQGASAPQTAWILHRPLTARLGKYRFGHAKAAEAVVARAAAKTVGWQVHPLRLGPNTFLVGRDHSIWLEDTWKQRMLVWRASKPKAPPRSVPLPTEGRRDVSFEDVAFGPKGTLYVTRNQAWTAGFQLFRINAQTGRILWKSNSYAAAEWDGLPRGGMPLRVGPDGTLYGLLSALDFETAGTPSQAWMPLATPAGKPIPPAQQFNGITWGYEPAPQGQRFIVENYTPPHANYIPREMRLAIINRHGQLLHAWRITSKTAIGGWLLQPQLLDGQVIVDLAPSAAGSKFEHFFVRLDGKGLDAKASVPYRIGGDRPPFTDVRVGPDRKIYALATSPKKGIVISRYTLGH